MKQGTIIWRMNGNFLINYWDSYNKKLSPYFITAENLQPLNVNFLHNENDYKEAKEYCDKIQQNGELYFLTN
jgi:hypothetical protein